MLSLAMTLSVNDLSNYNQNSHKVENQINKTSHYITVSYKTAHYKDGCKIQDIPITDYLLRGILFISENTMINV
jgi:hypothetical protein